MCENQLGEFLDNIKKEQFNLIAVNRYSDRWESRRNLIAHDPQLTSQNRFAAAYLLKVLPSPRDTIEKL